jgi:AraC family transcriptional regulator of adaptative response/methylated-DNA-[protein]-cysteine methyltransferase
MDERLEGPTAVLDYRRVERALRWLDANETRQPKMSELARAQNTTASHLSRVFSRWAGVPPKRFLTFLSKEHAKALLSAGKTTLDTSSCLGLASASRLHDLLVNADAITPGEYKTAGRGMTVTWGTHASPFGSCFVASTERGVFSMSFVDDGEAAVDGARREVLAELPLADFVRDDARAAEVVRRAFAGRGSTGAPLSLWLRGTPFQLKVWEAVLSLSPGSVASYGQVAAHVGRTGAARAVGSALAANRIAVLVPCHRVIRAVGETSAYRWGRDRKRLLLAFEAARRV